MKRTIGLSGAIFTVVGYIIGASIWILPGELAVTAGPGVVVAYTLAAIPSLFVCFVCAQIGCAYPVSGAAYVAVSRLISPLWGFIFVWSIVVAVVVAIALVAYGIADFLAFFWPEAPRLGVALGSVVLFTGVNLLGARLSVGAQSFLVVLFIVAMLVFGVGGIANADWSLLTPLLPNGFSPVLVATVAAFF